MAEAKWASYRLFPYEKALALREAAALGGTSAAPSEEGVTVPDAHTRTIVERATYFGSVTTGHDRTPTRQASTESLHAAVRGVEQRRQATRFGLHGIHEYKGKFNPQLVRSLMNVVDVDADLLIDPFCGSGTSLIEAGRLGVHAIGVDRSPIAVLLARAKTAALIAPDIPAVRDRFGKLVRSVADEMKEAQQVETVGALADLFSPDTESYLRDWFPQESLAAVVVALRRLQTDQADPAVALARVALSAILRAVSYQLPEDLRVRRRPEPFIPPQVWELFVESCDRVDVGLEEARELASGDQHDRCSPRQLDGSGSTEGHPHVWTTPDSDLTPVCNGPPVHRHRSAIHRCVGARSRVRDPRCSSGSLSGVGSGASLRNGNGGVVSMTTRIASQRPSSILRGRFGRPMNREAPASGGRPYQRCSIATSHRWEHASRPGTNTCYPGSVRFSSLATTERPLMARRSRSPRPTSLVRSARRGASSSTR